MKFNRFVFFSLMGLFFTSQVMAAKWVQTTHVPNVTPPLSPFFEQIVIDNVGNATAMTYEYDNTDSASGRLIAARLNNGELKWKPTNNFTQYPQEVLVNRGTNGNSPSAQLVISKEGLVATIWNSQQKNNQKNKQLKSSVLPLDSLKWEAAKTIASTKQPLSFLNNLAIAFDNHSRLYALWNHGESKELQQIMSSYLDLGASKWSTPVLVSSGELQKFNNEFPLLTVDPLQDRVVALWKVQKEIGSELYSAHLSIKENKWSAPFLLSAEKASLENYAVTQVNGGFSKNFAVACWYENPAIPAGLLKYAFLDETNKWSVSRTLVALNDITDLSIVIDKDQITTIVYSVAQEDSNEIFAITISANGKASKPELVAKLKTFSQQLVVDPSGKTTLLWSALIDDTYQGLYYADHPKGGEWTKPMLISNARLTPFIALAVNAAGTTIASWTGQSAGTNALYVGAAVRKGTLILPPACAGGDSGKEQFLLQSTYYNTVVWCESPSKDISKYHVYRNGTLIGSVKANDTLLFRDNGVKKDVHYIYTIRAINKNGAVSGPATTTLPLK